MDLTDPISTALLCVEAFDCAGLRHALCGGLALAAYGEPRETRDVDLAVVHASAKAARDALENRGVACAVAFEGVTFGGLSLETVTLLGGEAVLGLNTLDLVRPRSPRYATAVLDRSIEAPLRGKPIRVVSPEDFVILKLLATRDRDLDDAAAVLLRSRDALDLDLLRREVAELASEFADWDVRAR